VSVCPGESDVNLLRYGKGVIDLDTEVPDRAFLGALVTVGLPYAHAREFYEVTSHLDVGQLVIAVDPPKDRPSSWLTGGCQARLGQRRGGHKEAPPSQAGQVPSGRQVNYGVIRPS
jgi:hypothetical protein